jgi:PRTRC genetic system protein B
MNVTAKELTAVFKPALAVIVYKSDYESYEGNYYLESHNIGPSGEILEGKPLMQETLNDVVDVFFDERKNRTAISGFIPENLLSFDVLPGGFYSMMWFQPSQTKVMHFQESLKIPSGMAVVPALIYKVERKELSVYAIKTNDRPALSTALFRAPFHNVYESGLVCLGTAKIQKPVEKSYVSEMQYWEDLFWKSEFSHLNGSDSPTKSNLNLLWKKLITAKKRTWDDKQLKPFGKKQTLKNLF